MTVCAAYFDKEGNCFLMADTSLWEGEILVSNNEIKIIDVECVLSEPIQNVLKKDFNNYKLGAAFAGDAGPIYYIKHNWNRKVILNENDLKHAIDMIKVDLLKLLIDYYKEIKFKIAIIIVGYCLALNRSRIFTIYINTTRPEKEFKPDSTVYAVIGEPSLLGYLPNQSELTLNKLMNAVKLMRSDRIKVSAPIKYGFIADGTLNFEYMDEYKE